MTNRTYERAEELAQELGGEASPFSQLPQLLGEADIVVSTTGSPGHVLTLEMVQQATLNRDSRPLFLMDIAVPRDIDPRARRLDNVYLYNIDDLLLVSEANRMQRAQEANKVEAIVEEEVDAFMEWWRSLAVVPTIGALRRQAEAIRQAELARTLRRLNGLGEEERARVEAMSRAIVKKLLHKPTAVLRQRMQPGHTQAVRELFGLDGRPK